jgi:hypothetical protein
MSHPEFIDNPNPILATSPIGFLYYMDLDHGCSLSAFFSFPSRKSDMAAASSASMVVTALPYTLWLAEQYYFHTNKSAFS